MPVIISFSYTVQGHYWNFKQSIIIQSHCCHDLVAQLGNFQKLTTMDKKFAATFYANFYGTSGAVRVFFIDEDDKPSLFPVTWANYIWQHCLECFLKECMAGRVLTCIASACDTIA